MEEQGWGNYFNMKGRGKEAGNTKEQTNKTDGNAIMEKGGKEIKIWKKQREFLVTTWKF